MNQDQTLIDRLKTAALTGAASGGLLGAGSALLGGGKSLRGILRKAAIGAAGGGIAAPAAIGAGEAVLGAPEQDEKNPYVRRGLVGGAIIGGGLGGGISALLASGKKLPLTKMGAFGDKIKTALSADNIILNKLREYAENPSRSNIVKGTLLGTGIGAFGGAEFSADEGLNLDAIQNEIEAAKIRKQKRGIVADV